ncbi:MAG: sigma-54 interaction domain-containing protein [Bacilli bacterium]
MLADQDHMLSSALLPVLLDALEEAVTIVDREATVRYWNRAAERLHGISADQIVGKCILDFTWNSLMVEHVLRDGAPIRQAYHEPQKGKHVIINTLPVRDDAGRVVGAVSTEQDVTYIVRLGNELMQTTSRAGTTAADAPVQERNDPWSILWGNSRTLLAIVQTARRVAQTDVNVLITGESGVGKELFAQSIHDGSLRQRGPFITINCGAIPAPLFESELFGYQGGSFTGSDRNDRAGKIELAHGGTLFLDEVGELTMEMQVKLLRFLEDRSFYRVGGSKPVRVDIRIVAATNQNLRLRMEEGLFREDLFYRLNVVTLRIPPLRERLEDVPLLIQRFLREFSLKYNKPIPVVDPSVIIALMSYSWPGNIRQLRNAMERLVILAEEGNAARKHLPEEIRDIWEVKQGGNSLPANPTPEHNSPVWRAGGRRVIGVEEIRAALYRTYGNKHAAAKQLGISRGTLYNYLKRYGMDIPAQ